VEDMHVQLRPRVVEQFNGVRVPFGHNGDVFIRDTSP
jgi:hypothetical protein